MAADIAVINAGSKTGTFFVESQIIANELAKQRQVDFANPGNACVAQSLVKQSRRPTLFLWDSTYEAQGRLTNNKDCQIDWQPADVIRVDSFSWKVCSINPRHDRDAFIKSLGKYRVGHANPAGLFARNIAATNAAFKTGHVAVHYTAGLGSIVTALQNGEIDYAILSTKTVLANQNKGLVCHWNLGDKDDELPSLARASGDANNVNLLGMFQVLLVAKNFDPADRDNVKSVIRISQETAGTPLSDLYRGLPGTQWTQPADKISREWEKSVEVNMVR